MESILQKPSDKLTNLFVLLSLILCGFYLNFREEDVMISGPDKHKDESEKELPGLQTRAALEYRASKKVISQ